MTNSCCHRPLRWRHVAGCYLVAWLDVEYLVSLSLYIFIFSVSVLLFWRLWSAVLKPMVDSYWSADWSVLLSCDLWPLEHHFLLLCPFFFSLCCNVTISVCVFHLHSPYGHDDWGTVVIVMESPLILIVFLKRNGFRLILVRHKKSFISLSLNHLFCFLLCKVESQKERKKALGDIPDVDPLLWVGTWSLAFVSWIFLPIPCRREFMEEKQKVTAELEGQKLGIFKESIRIWCPLQRVYNSTLHPELFHPEKTLDFPAKHSA